VSAEKRIFRIGTALVAAGAVITAVLIGWVQGLSLAAGGLLAALNLAWLRGTVNAIMLRDPKRSQRRVLGEFFFRLLLIPLCLYAMIRFLFLSAPALMAGFALFLFSVLIEGILEALGHNPK